MYTLASVTPGAERLGGRRGPRAGGAVDEDGVAGTQPRLVEPAQHSREDAGNARRLGRSQAVGDACAQPWVNLDLRGEAARLWREDGDAIPDIQALLRRDLGANGCHNTRSPATQRQILILGVFRPRDTQQPHGDHDVFKSETSSLDADADRSGWQAVLVLRE